MPLGARKTLIAKKREKIPSIEMDIDIDNPPLPPLSPLFSSPLSSSTPTSTAFISNVTLDNDNLSFSLKLAIFTTIKKKKNKRDYPLTSPEKT